MRAVCFSLIALIGASFLSGSLAAGADTYTSVTFDRDIEPILTRAGCNAGACHGKASGQNGFKLSLLGFDPEFDHLAITREAGGRRILRAIPEQSLLLQKATARVPHGGGRRIDPAGPFYETLRRWIVAGFPRTPPGAPKLERLATEPGERRLAPERIVRTERDGSLH